MSTATVPSRGPWLLFWRRARSDWVALVSATFLVLLVAFACAAPAFEAWTGHPKNQSNVAGSDDTTLLPVRPGTNCNGLQRVGQQDCFVFGASNVEGYDMLVQLSYGARTSLYIGLVTTVLTVAISLMLALLAGYHGGWIDSLISRLMDVTAAFPFLLFAIAMSVAFGASRATVIGALVIFGWFYPGRLFRSEVLVLREQDFIAAARMHGSSTTRIFRRHIASHLSGPLITYVAFGFSAAVAGEAALSFLGFGLPSDVPSWGRMISDSIPGGLYRNAPHAMLIPGSMLVATVIALNLLGDGVRNALDPDPAARLISVRRRPRRGTE